MKTSKLVTGLVWVLPASTANIASVNLAQADGELYDSPFLKGWYTGVDNLQISKSTTQCKGRLKRIPLSVMHRITNLPETGVMTL